MREQGTILIVDDDSSARDTLEALLFQEGYDLFFAANGQEALERIDDVNPDVILLDVMMPGMDGFQVCQVLKTGPNWRHVPIILVTALDSREDMVRGFDAGGDDFVSKPIDGLELRARVRSMLRIKRQYDLLEAQRRELQETLHLRSKLAWVTAQRLAELERLYQAGLRLMNSLDVDYVIEQTGRTALELMLEAEHCVVHLVLKAETGLERAVLLSRDGSLSIHPRVGTEQWALDAIVSKDVVYVPRVEADPRYADCPLQGFQTLLVSPLLVDRRCIGTLSVDSSREDAFEVGQRRLLSILANQAAVTLMKARLFEELNELVAPGEKAE